MSQTATPETGTPEAPAVVMPDKPFTPPETPEAEVPEGAGTPESKTPETQAPESSTPEQADQPADKPEKEIPKPENPVDAQVKIYQDVLAKHDKDPKYEMSDSEADAFLAVQDLVTSGQIEEPGLKKEDTPAPKEKDEQTSEGGDIPPESGKEPSKDGLTGLPNQSVDSLMGAMKKVGAKDVDELEGKIDGLLTHMKTSGGKIGTELAEARKREASHIQWMDDLRAGKPEAYDYLKQITGKDAPASSSTDTGKPGSGKEESPTVEMDGNPDDYLDDKLAPLVLSQKKEISELKNQIAKLADSDKKRDDIANRTVAANGWIDDIVDLVVNNQKDFAISPSEARELGKQYWGPEGATSPVHPKFQQIHELIQFAHQRSMPDLKSAHIVWQHENGDYAQKLIRATKDGQISVQHKPSPNSFLSKEQGRMKSNVPAPHITDESFEKMQAGDFNSIPDEWMDDDGNLIRDKIPQRFHKLAFGRAG